MKAKFETRSPVAERIDLAEAIPLVSPLTVIAEVTSVCNLRCNFCPTGDPKLTKSTGKFRGLMPMETFEKLVTEINYFPAPVAALHLHKDGEPLAHPHFCDMVALARRSTNIRKIETTTNGVLLNPALNMQLADCGLNRIKISVYGLDSSSFKQSTGVAVDFERYVENIADLHSRCTETEIYVKTMEEGLTESQKEFFLKTFGNIADTIFFEHCVDTWPDFKFDGVRPISSPTIGILGQGVRPYKKVCPQPFYNLTVCADGKVTACCADWEVKLVVGNIHENRLLDIWNNDAYNDFRLMMLRGERRSHPICGGCGYPTYTCVDDIDDVAEQLLNAIRS